MKRSSNRLMQFLKPGSLAKHSARMFFWMALRSCALAATVILLARDLGSDRYGQVVAVTSVASFLVPFSGLGLSIMVLRNAARDPVHEAVYFAYARKWWARTLLPCVTIAITLALVLLPAGLPMPVVFITIGSEIAALSLIELVGRHRQAQQNVSAFGAINAGLPLVRLFAFAALFFLTGAATAATVLWIYAGSGLLYALLLMRAAPIRAEAANASTPQTMTARSGLPFSMAAFAARLQGEFNKPILAHAGYTLVGSYSVAQRAVDMASLPLLAVQETLWPRLYTQHSPMRQLRRTGIILLIFAAILGCGLWITAPLLAWILGPSYSDSITVLRLLAWMPTLQVLRSLLNFHVIHIGRNSLVGWAHTAGAAASVLGVLVLVPPFGMLGAVITSYAAELLMIGYFLLKARGITSQNIGKQFVDT